MNDIKTDTTYLQTNFPVKQVRPYSSKIDTGQKPQYLLFLNHQDQTNVEKTANDMVSQGFTSAKAIKIGQSWDIVVNCDEVSSKVQSAAAQSGAFPAESGASKHASKAATQAAAAASARDFSPLNFTSFETKYGKMGFLKLNSNSNGTATYEFSLFNKTKIEAEEIIKQMKKDGLNVTTKDIPAYAYLLNIDYDEMKEYINKLDK